MTNLSYEPCMHRRSIHLLNAYTYIPVCLCPVPPLVFARLLDAFRQSVRDVMQARIEKAAAMKCDAIEPDNMSVSVVVKQE